MSEAEPYPDRDVLVDTTDDLLCAIGRHAPYIAEGNPRQIDACAIPQRYRRLLVHEDSMTEVLERHFNERLVLRVLWSQTTGSSYLRYALLAGEMSRRPAELGAIRL